MWIGSTNVMCYPFPDGLRAHRVLFIKSSARLGMFLVSSGILLAYSGAAVRKVFFFRRRKVKTSISMMQGKSSAHGELVACGLAILDLS